MRMKVSNYISQKLVDFGITQVFTVTGGGAMHLNDALGHQEGLTCLYNHHEQACAIAAECYARVQGRIAAVCVIGRFYIHIIESKCRSHLCPPDIVGIKIIPCRTKKLLRPQYSWGCFVV